MKISISRSISTVFEQYMEKISWSEKKYSLEDFIKQWQLYINEHASWYEKLDDDIKKDPTFHDELAEKINETIKKFFLSHPQMIKLNPLKSCRISRRKSTCILVKWKQGIY
ncbi:hypothetical protein J6TS2_29170 [Heyndrickxia sporothermodurans]|nr:hypothetical protein J6TS2_29170 [Heyndrickxia sporothermodurans]